MTPKQYKSVDIPATVPRVGSKRPSPESEVSLSTTKKLCTSKEPSPEIQQSSDESNKRPFTPVSSTIDCPSESDRKSSEASTHVLSQHCPYTIQFFNDMANTIANIFPYEEFARDHHCTEDQVLQAINAVVVSPLVDPDVVIVKTLDDTISEYGIRMVNEWNDRFASVLKASTGAQQQSIPRETVRPATSVSAHGLKKTTRDEKPSAECAREEVRQDSFGNYEPVTPPGPKKEKKQGECRRGLD